MRPNERRCVPRDALLAAKTKRSARASLIFVAKRAGTASRRFSRLSSYSTRTCLVPLASLLHRPPRHSALGAQRLRASADRAYARKGARGDDDGGPCVLACPWDGDAGLESAALRLEGLLAQKLSAGHPKI